MSAAKLVQARIGPVLGAALKAHGFRRKALVFRRDGAQVVAVQSRAGKERGEAAFVLELGVFLPDVERVLRCPARREPSQPECTVQTRVGPKGAGDRWWSIREGTEAPPSLMARLEEVAVPWFAMASDLATVSDNLGDAGVLWCRDRLVPVGVALVLGDRSLAEARLHAEVAAIEAKRAERAVEFPKDPFGLAVLERAARVAEEHELALR
jgi:hypothetical protein